MICGPAPIRFANKTVSENEDGSWPAIVALIFDDGVEILALWALHTHAFESFAHSPRLAITSPEKGCGKTTTLDVLGELVARPLPSSNASVAAVFRIIEMAAPTLLIDEADTFLKENYELRGILNTGHRRGGQVTRTVGDESAFKKAVYHS